jgi:hypothetical protein
VRFLTARAGLIFSGTVLSVERRPASRASEIETIEVHFRVEQPVRGVRAGQTVSIREWAGLWVSGARYHVGERRMLFLYPPSKLGLTSPVAGLGSFAVDRAGWLRPTPRQRQLLDEEGFLPRVIDSNHRIAVRDFARTVRRAAEE